MVNIVAREKRHVHVGDVIDLHLIPPGDDATATVDAKVKVVGISASLGDFASVATPGLIVTSAFADRYKSQAATRDLFLFFLHRGDADLSAFRTHISALTGGKPVLYVEGRNDWRQIQRSF